MAKKNRRPGWLTAKEVTHNGVKIRILKPTKECRGIEGNASLKTVTK